jgi:hypothetical protein
MQHCRAAGWLTSGEVKGSVVGWAHDALVRHLALQCENSQQCKGASSSDQLQLRMLSTWQRP